MPLQYKKFLESIRAMSDEALIEKIKEEKIRLKKLEFMHAVSPLENPILIRGLRRDIARMNGELTQRKLQKA
ncbi:MAG: 50S ribosomal protein L29 [Chitinophagaceae bacterium]